ncbi:hypothetical protein LJB99_02925 [Deltaproteobacteria bacterium OttesenSCG-928-K17]|nr:hypothetical protein [Deltaproteobacteria bacterium OttesenSCG-928-K17]
MKNIIITACFIIATFLTAAPALASQDPADLMEMEKAGLSSATISRFLSQSLTDGRKAPPISAKLLTRLGRHGGDHLAKTYLDLDKASAHLASPDLTPAMIDRMMSAKIPPSEMQLIIGEEIAKLEAAQKQAKAPLMPPSLPPAAGEVDIVSPSEIMAAAMAPAPAPAPAPREAAVPMPAAVDISSPRLPQAQPRPAGFQDLRPGQAADPASRLPLPHSTYDIRSNRQYGDVRRHNPGGPWMGVVEKELPDGHVVEANSIGQTSAVGQEVYSRPSGHKVYRYYTGNPDAPYSGADARQEQINRDNLNTIFSSRRDARQW